MKKVLRSELLDLQSYEKRRDAIRRAVMKVKALRRIHLGNYLTFLFENPDTVRYQVQEMLRAERIVKAKDVKRELDVYNELLGGRGELGATLLIEIDDPADRRVRLEKWRRLPEHLYALLKDGERVPATFDERQRDTDRLSAVQFLKFPVQGRVPVALGTDFPTLRAEAKLTPSQRRALAVDLS